MMVAERRTRRGATPKPIARGAALAVAGVLLTCCQSSCGSRQSGSENARSAQPAEAAARQKGGAQPEQERGSDGPLPPPAEGLKVATFAGGCFWCMEPPFEKLEGVTSVTSGYTGGEEKNPTYEEVSAGETGHAEAVRVIYDPSRVSYDKLLDVFWRNIDPTQADGQFADIGSQYRTAIFVHDEEQKKKARASKEALANSGRFEEAIVTDVVPAGPFYAAEAYHQDFYKKNPTRYRSYRRASGREAFLERVWDDG